jgi:hypothetical protein
MKNEIYRVQIRRLLLFFIISLFLSGATAIPVDRELAWLLQFVPSDTTVIVWGMRVLKSYVSVKQQYPFLLYGYDWLAFAHFVLAILFIGPYKDPVKNSWVVQFGLIACVLVIPYALLVGAVRGIPLWWRLIDCSFGVLGLAVLVPCYLKIKKLSTQHPPTTFSNPQSTLLLWNRENM